ncbi:TPA: amino acid permease [Stenotrophomonas maltophilia]|uniref:Arginine/agmatine antiporter n=1 Tax=Marilutibacter maris TaxID=1605891 RepID=A0A508ASL6_9GAMM|nr:MULTISPECIES: amino acid permease [Xanthomonadaceae]KAB8188917.1 amino acid permease [Lysobacter maris]MBN5004128.1 amino acid permease [Stenotrophomonas maltophilia]MCF3494287.1 amino acid permease [Stenotrophomonas maltophilia]MCF3514595.1 amino acid permease [Stenotrophomonas maltophilia]MCO7477915.1 amino acid permease [Stenotrophomonas maltophilia]
MSTTAPRKMGLTMATMLVAGNMIGTGVFLLPANLATVGSISSVGWVIATAGAIALGLVFARLSQINPQPGGPYAYARDTFGNYVGFVSNYAYWFGNWIGNVAIALVVTGYLSHLWPWLEGIYPRLGFTLAVIWLLSLANARGARWIGALETGTLLLALIPILSIAIAGWWWFDADMFMAGWNVSGMEDSAAISRSASIALWAFMGVESAAVSADVIDNPKRNIPLATLLGLALAAVIYISCSLVIMGMLPMEALRDSSAPFADVAKLMIGPWGVVVIALCAIFKSIGALGGWMLLVGQSAKAAAEDGLFPRVFCKLNRHGMPGTGLMIVAVLMSGLLLVTSSPTLARQFDQLTNIAVLLTIIPYLFSAGALAATTLERNERGWLRAGCLLTAAAAVAYCLYALLGADAQLLAYATVAMLFSAALYPFFRKRMLETGSGR